MANPYRADPPPPPAPAEPMHAEELKDDDAEVTTGATILDFQEQLRRMRETRRRSGALRLKLAEKTAELEADKSHDPA